MMQLSVVWEDYKVSYTSGGSSKKTRKFFLDVGNAVKEVRERIESVYIKARASFIERWDVGSDLYKVDCLQKIDNDDIKSMFDSL